MHCWCPVSSGSWASCYCPCAESAISELPAPILTTPLDSATPMARYFDNRNTFSLLFLHFAAKNPPHFCFRSTCCNFVKKSPSHVTLCPAKGDNFYEMWSLSDHTSPSYDAFNANTLRYIATLTTDLLILNSCGEFFVTWANTLPTLSILHWSILALRCSQSDC